MRRTCRMSHRNRSDPRAAPSRRPGRGFVAAVVALLLLAADATARAGDDADESGLESSIASLASDDGAVRGAAAHRIAELGTIAIERAVRASAALGDPGWTALAEAVRKEDRRPLAVAVVAGAHELPVAARARALVLAREIDPEAARPRTSEELAAWTHRILVEERGQCNREYFPFPVQVHGRDALPVVMRYVRDAKALGADPDRANWMLRELAQREDVADLRKMLVGGNTIVVDALARLQALGIQEAADALVDGVDAGCLDDRLWLALTGHSIDGSLVRTFRVGGETALVSPAARRRAVESLRRRFASPGRPLGDADRARTAAILACFDSREDIAEVETWAQECRDAASLLAIAKSLVRLGSREGAAALVRMAVAATRKPTEAARNAGTPESGAQAADAPVPAAEAPVPPPSTAAPAPAAPAQDPFADGFESWIQCEALTWLGDVEFESRTPAGTRPAPKDGRRRWHADGPWTDVYGDARIRATQEVREWWKSAKDDLRFDVATGRWQRRN